MQATKYKGNPKKVGTYKADGKDIKTAQDICIKNGSNLSNEMQLLVQKIITGTHFNN